MLKNFYRLHKIMLVVYHNYVDGIAHLEYWLSYVLDNQGFGLIPAKGMSIQNNSGARPPSCPVGTKIYFSKDKVD